MDARDIVHDRLQQAGLASDRFLNVEDGGKRSYDHDRRFDAPPEGNYGIYATPTDGLVLIDIDDYEDLDDSSGLAALADLAPTLEQESAHGGTHKLYRVPANQDGRLVAAVLDDVFGATNPNPSWGEVRVANQYIVGAGSALDDGCQYAVQADREIASVSAETLVDVLAADPDLQREDITPEAPTDVDADGVDIGNEEERLELALESDEKLERLWEGDYRAYGGDRSAAESALAMKLGWWFQGDKQTVRRLMDRADAEKWAARTDDSYRDSVLGAVDQLSDTFDAGAMRRTTTASAEAAESARETAGDDAGEASMDLEERVRARVLTPLDPPEDYPGEEIDLPVAVDRFADILTDEYHFVRPRTDVRGWRDTLYVYVDDSGIYEPHGESFIGSEAERLLGAIATNQRVEEIVKKVQRQSLVRPGELTAKPHRLVVANGIVDLHTGELTDLTAEEYHRTRLDVAFDPDAECPRIDEFFHEIVADSDVRTLYQLVAHCLYKEYLEEKAAMLLGDGQNGKSVYLALLEEFLGGYNVSRRSLQDFSENDYAANNLQGKLANLHPDMAAQTVDQLGVFKQLTGRDTVVADVKYERPIHFENHATLIFAANRMPKMTEDTHALWRRWIYVNFPHTFAEHDPEAKDPTPKRRLMGELTAEAELQGLLARAVEELSRWADEGTLFTNVAPPHQVREKMKRASEPVYDFAMTCLEMGDEDDAVPKDQVRQCYREFAREEGLPTIADSAFGERLLNLRDLTIESSQRRVDGTRKRVYTNLRFSSRGRQILGLDEGDDEPNLSDTAEQKSRRAVEVVRQLEDPGNGGARRGVVVGRLSSEMSMPVAQNAIDEALRKGEIYETADDVYQTTS